MKRSILPLLSLFWPPLVLLAVVVAAWWIADITFDVPTYLVPSPPEVALAMHGEPEMFARAMLVTALSALGGLLVSAVLGVIAGSVIASRTILYRSAYPLATLLQMVPLVAIAPLLVIWCGYGPRTSLASAVIVSIFPVIASTVDGLRGTDRQWVELFDLYGIRGVARWRKLSFPAALPSIMTGLRVASGLAVIGAIVGEFVGGFSGDWAPLGSVIMSSLRQARTDLVFAAIMLGALVGFLLFGIVSFVSHLALRRWHASARAVAALALSALTAFATAGLGGCADRASNGDGAPLKVQLDWVPEPEFGGLYAGLQTQAFAALGRPLQIIKGGPALATPQLLAQGVCDVAIMGGDQLVTARAQGADVVAVYATFVESPYGIMAHASNPANTLEQLWTGGGTIAVEDGLPYVRLLGQKFGTKGAKFVPYAGSLAPFEADKNYAQQIFVTAEPVQMALKHIEIKVFPVAEYYNPYVGVYAVRGSMLGEQPALVEALVAGLRQGWDRYLAEPTLFNPAIAAENPAMTLEAMNLGAVAERPLIRPDGMPVEELGAMSEARWASAITTLEELGLVKAGAVRAKDCFVNFSSSPPAKE